MEKCDFNAQFVLLRSNLSKIEGLNSNNDSLKELSVKEDLINELTEQLDLEKMKSEMAYQGAEDDAEKVEELAIALKQHKSTNDQLEEKLKK